MSFRSQGLVRPHSSKLAFVHRVLDGVAIIGALELALALTDREVSEVQYGQLGAWAVLLFVMIGGARHIYGSSRIEPLHTVVMSSVFTWLLTVVALVFLAFLGKSTADYSRLATLVWFGLTPIFLAVLRIGLRFVLQATRAAGRNTRTLAIAGKTPVGIQVLEKIQKAPWLGMQFVGFFDDRLAKRECKNEVADVDGVGRFVELIARARAGEIDYVYITLPMKAETRIVGLVEALADTTASVYMVPDFFIFDLLHGKLSSLDGIPVLSLHESPFYGVDGWLKRLEDIVVASLILLLIAIPMLVIAATVKLTSPGPVLFKQRRYGLNGKVVEVWKFRSMTVTEDGARVVQAQKNDARITPFGAFMRRTSLDELPQFFNVLQGGMSVVGPRPHAVAHNEQYRSLIRGYMLRHKVKPGITGWAQVSGWRGETETLDKMAMRVKFDLEYVQNWSLWLDVKIIFLTLFKGFVNKNAY